MVFQRSLSDNKSPQVSRTLLCILADLNNAVVWIVFTRPLISKSSSPCTSSLATVPRASITIGRNVSSMFQFFLIPLQGSSTRPYFCFFQFYSVVCRDSKVHNSESPLIIIIIIIIYSEFFLINFS